MQAEHEARGSDVAGGYFHWDSFERRASAGVGVAKGVLALDPSGALHPASGLSSAGETGMESV
jgi:hypothetical protein